MLRTFRLGGVHPPENKLSANGQIRELPLPAVVSIPTGQHIGAPATPLVKKGDKVKTGQLIAKSTGFVSANIHSSVSGTVTKVEGVPDASGYPRTGIVIKVDGDEWEEQIDRSPDLVRSCALSGPEIVEKIASAGIVGMGGATFPTHIKLVPPKGMKADLLIINGVECEPYLTADNRLMIEKSREILVGTELLMKALGVEKATIGIEGNKPEAIRLMKEAVADFRGITVEVLRVKYPQGGEKQLINAITGREVPSGALPVAVGCVVSNVGTAFAVYEAVQKNKPLFERVLTITGKHLQQPSNLKVRVGTPLSEVVAFAGGLPEDTGKIISGGPMMGKAVASLEIPVTKGTSGVLLMPGEESLRNPQQPCIRCSRCAANCPMGLEPFLLMTLTEKTMWERLEKEKVLDCIECGSCSYTCPASRPLLDHIRFGKAKVGQMVRSRKN
ncbi:MAG TPA: electron transport complex subunit RsxC [Prolixibacteraceae bacterium]|nr:electron transport complex subunit RsxC [Bacteroidales bacterium]HNQ36315.1 electron transport complex subunit RsxC [Prolixibacteraceae bacterium]HPJ77518.1 electron transport complex subunit RsxC [Prolixibacteraceae bacterium]HRV88190.1 electron transport complex subunit RsxC [Prolixibacteraceae bacterium]